MWICNILVDVFIGVHTQLIHSCFTIGADTVCLDFRPGSGRSVLLDEQETDASAAAPSERCLPCDYRKVVCFCVCIALCVTSVLVGLSVYVCMHTYTCKIFVLVLEHQSQCLIVGHFSEAVTVL